ncbi:MAG: phage baseplate assembly protein V [Trueperaceae bacterium]|nr:phage baseplate assembly protein V [Trueperaceae bacterium]
MDGQFNDIEQRLRQYSDARVESAELVDSRIEITCTLVPDGDEVVALATSAFGGNKGGVYRIPKAGETVVVSMQDGDPTRARIIGYAPTSNDAVPDGVEEDALVFAAPDGETLKISATADVEITSDGANITVTSDGGDVAVASKSGKVTAGSLAASIALALAPPVKAKLTEIIGQYNGHVHMFVAPLIPVAPAPTTPTASQVTPTGDIGTKNLKGD